MTEDLLQALSELSGVSGNEHEVRHYLTDQIREHVDELRSDTIGNLVAVKHPRSVAAAESRLRVMLTAHMDEVGLMVTHIDNNGLLRFAAVGGVDERILPAKAVLVGKNKVPGVIGLKPIHLLKPEERKHIPGIDSLHIDIGASTREEAEKLVKIGDYVSFPTRYVKMGQYASGKAFDDRAGCAIIVELLKQRYPFTLLGVFSTQEEVRLRGARIAAYRLEPHVAFAIEGTVCDDTPKKKDVSPTTVMGQGPAVTIADRSLIADQMLVSLILETARSQGIPHQIKQPLIGGTDAGAIQRVREGIRSAVVAVPVRYIHSSVSVLNLADYQNTLRLMRGVLERIAQDRSIADQILS